VDSSAFGLSPTGEIRGWPFRKGLGLIGAGVGLDSKQRRLLRYVGLRKRPQLGQAPALRFKPTLDICHGICHMKAMTERHVKLFKNGRNQAVRIPREFELPGEDAIIRKEGQRLIIEAAPPRSLLAVLATLQTLDENFPPIEDPPAEPVDL
jgi:antitoxin VapB